MASISPTELMIEGRFPLVAALLRNLPVALDVYTIGCQRFQLVSCIRCCFYSQLCAFCNSGEVVDPLPLILIVPFSVGAMVTL